MTPKGVLSISTFLLVFRLSAQTCCSGGVPLSNNLGLPNEGKGTLVLGLHYDYNNLSTLNAGGETLDDDARLRLTNSILINLGYGLTDRISLEALFTWVNQSRTISQFGNENFTETTGIGDAVLLAKYAFPNVFGMNSLVNIGLGVKAPLGASDLTTEEGFQLTADLQPGSGAWDALGWLSVSKNMGFRPSATISGSFIYRFTGENDSYLDDTSVYEFGDVAQANVGYSDQFLWFNTLFYPGVVLKYRRANRDQIEGSDVPNTGGEWVFVRPELAVGISPSLRLGLRLELPLYHYVNGTQLTPTWRFTGGITLTFLKKNINLIN